MQNLKQFLACIIWAQLSLTAMGQTTQSSSQAHSQLAQDFEFSDETGKREVVIEVGNEVDMLSFAFQSKISGGNLTMSILDPNGKREGGFVLEAIGKEGKRTNRSTNQNTNQNSNDGVHTYTMVHSRGSKSSGSMTKQIEHPIAGVWKVTIQSQDLTGSLSIHMGQQSQSE